jgi:integrase
MPLKLIEPRPGRSPNWRIRGTYLRVYIDQSSGSGKRSVAQRKLKAIERQIECGEITQEKGTFAHAAAIYLQGGGERRYAKPLIEHFGLTKLTEIDQAAVDEAAKILLPPGITEEPSSHNANINRQIHTPVSAILTAGGFPLRLKRPKMPKGKVNWIRPDEAERWLKECPRKLRRLSVFLLYTGCRIGEALSLQGDHIDYRGNLAYLGRTKNDQGRAVHLPPVVMSELREIIAGRGVEVFGYNDRWEVYDDWNPVKERLGFPDWWTPHACCHTWATWMRQYAGMDIRGLLGTDRWKDLKSVLRYQHVVTSEESRAADRLPSVQNAWSGTKKATDTAA